MTSQPDIEQQQQAARRCVHAALGLIKRPKSSQNFILVDTANALDQLCRAAVFWPDQPSLRDGTAEAVISALYELAPKLTEAAEGEISAEDIDFALGNATGLLSVGHDSFYHDRLNYACILSAQLKMAFHRRDLRARGYPMAQAIQMKRIMEMPRLPTDPIN